MHIHAYYNTYIHKYICVITCIFTCAISSVYWCTFGTCGHKCNIVFLQRAEVKQLKQNLEKVEKTKSEEIEHLKRRILDLESKLKTDDKNEEANEELPPKV